MSEFRRHKALGRSFHRIGVDEADLARFARTIREATRDYGGEVEIVVTSADGAETFRPNDPEFLESKDMPAHVRSAAILYREYKAPLECRLQFSTRGDGSAELTVDGTDVHRVTGLFDDLSRQIDGRRLVGRWLTARIDRLWLEMALGLLVAVAIYSAFDIGLDLADVRWPHFKGSGLRSGIASIGWLCVLVGWFAGGAGLRRLLAQSFPVVEFRGDLADAQGVRRSVIFWVFSAIFMPILVRSMSGLVVDLMRGR